MKPAVCVFVVLLITSAAAQLVAPTSSKGAIYGVVVTRDGQRAKGINLTAYPLGVFVLAGILPTTRTNDVGEYRFENLDFGRYNVYADDEEAGYSIASNGPLGDRYPRETEISQQHSEAEFLVYLPPKAGFLEIHLTNEQTGDSISSMRLSLIRAANPDSLLFRISCYSRQVILVPPDKALLLHVSSDGFREWSESRGQGKAIQIQSGARLVLNVQLEPSE